MASRIFACATYEDGRRVDALIAGDQVGLRMYAVGAAGVEQVGEWRGATIRDRKVGAVWEITVDGIEDPLPFTLEHWGGCHCHHVLKRYRPPAWEPA